MRWIATVFIFIFLAGCTPEKTSVTPPVVGSEVTPALTLETTAAMTSVATETPFPAVTKDCSRGDHFDEIESGGQARQYSLHVPATYRPEEPAALVMVFHGAGISAERFVDYTRFSMVADREGFLIVYPQGQGPKEESYWDASPGSRDAEFINDLIDHLQNRCHIDPTRIYASGHSNGGGMVNRLACELADRIAAIGPVSGAYSSGTCSPSRPIPVFAIHGTADSIVPYDGIPEWASDWAERNGCGPEPAIVDRNILISERQWKDCREGADVILYTIVDVGHDWTHDLINIGQTIWDFFELHPMKQTTP